MSVDPSSPSVIFIHALLGQTPTPAELTTLDPIWSELVQAALDATPDTRRATLLLAKSGQTNLNRLLSNLSVGPPPEQPADIPWPDPIPFGRPPLPSFPDHVLPHWLGNYVRAEARATQTPRDLPGLLALAVLSTALAGHVVANPWGDWIEPINLFLMVVLPPGHRKSAVFADVTQPLQQYQSDAAAALAPHIEHARRRYQLAEHALQRAQRAAALAPAPNSTPNPDPTPDSDPTPAPLPALSPAPTPDTLSPSSPVPPSPASAVPPSNRMQPPDHHAEIERRAHEFSTIHLPVLPRLIVDDCSPERLAMLLHQQGGRLAILSPEGGIFDLISGRYSSTGGPNLDHILKGHAGDAIIVDRVGRPGEIIPRPALTIGLTIQPEVLRGLITRPGFHGRGLLARFLYALPNDQLGHRDVDAPPIPASLRDTYRQRIHALLTAFRPPHFLPRPSPSLPASHPQNPEPRTQNLVLPFSDSAAERLRTFARAIEPRLAPTGDLDPLIDWGSKLVGAVARLSALLHLAETSDSLLPSPSQGPGERLAGGGGSPASIPPVTPEAVDAAVILADYLIAHAHAAYAAMGADPATANLPFLLSWLRRSGLTSFTRRDALRASQSRFRSALDLDKALDQLEQHGYIRLRSRPHRPHFGRPRSPTYDVHPSLSSTTTSD